MSAVKSNRLAYNATVSLHSTFAIDIDITRRLRFDGLDGSGKKAMAFLGAGHDIEDLSALCDDVEMPGFGYLADIERQGADLPGLKDEPRSLFQLAHHVGAEGVQILTGPLDVRAVTSEPAARAAGLYAGLVGRTEPEQLSLTARNVQLLADMAQEFGLILYIEALAWTPLNTIDKQIEVIRRAERENVKMVIDFWHCYASGDTPDRIAKMDKNDIFGVHICDSLPMSGAVPDETVARNVATGQGVINLQDWVDAVKATGYDNWWSCELFSTRQRQENSYQIAQDLLAMMQELVLR
jgi:sugar phosphate isomerase/epimerase